jgi:hypothetical protein
VKRLVLAWCTAVKWLFLVIWIAWIIGVVVATFQGEWGRVRVGLAAIVGFGLLNFVIIPLGLPRLLRRVAPPKSN